VTLYGLGMGSAVSVLTVAVAFTASAVLVSARGLARYIEPLSVVLLLLAGGYIVYYWLTLGGLLRVLDWPS